MRSMRGKSRAVDVREPLAQWVGGAYSGSHGSVLTLDDLPHPDTLALAMHTGGDGASAGEPAQETEEGTIEHAGLHTSQHQQQQ